MKKKDLQEALDKQVKDNIKLELKLIELENRMPLSKAEIQEMIDNAIDWHKTVNHERDY